MSTITKGRSEVLTRGLDTPTLEERRAAWLADRRTCITGTEISAILGLSKWMRPIDVWSEKMGFRDNSTKSWQHAGHRFERAILEEYAEQNGVTLQFADPYQLIHAPGFSLLGATLDARRLDDGCPVDAKNLRYKDAYEVNAQGVASGFGDEGSDQIPTYYALQLHVQMMATETLAADLACCFTGQDFQTFTVRRDFEIDAMLQDTVTDWWQKHILGNVAPEPDGSESYGEYLKKRFARNTDVLIEPDAAMCDLGSALQSYKSELARVEQEKDQVEQQIKALIGDAQGIKGLCTWKNNRDGEKIDWKVAFDELRGYVLDNKLWVIKPQLDIPSPDWVVPQCVRNATEIKPGARVFRLAK